MVAKSYCPVCGYDLKLPNSESVVEKCPSCSFKLGKIPFDHIDTDNIHVRIWRMVWVEDRMPWCSQDLSRPSAWDPIRQMQAIGVHLGISFEDWEQNNPAICRENGPKFLQLALQKIAQLGWNPEVIEALWDGDTQGW